MERCKQKDLLAEMLAEMTGDFPTLYKVFVSERDQYLARSLRLSAAPIEIHSPEGGNYTNQFLLQDEWRMDHGDHGDVGSNPAQGNYSFPQKLSSVEFPVTFYIYLYNNPNYSRILIGSCL